MSGAIDRHRARVARLYGAGLDALLGDMGTGGAPSLPVEPAPPRPRSPTVLFRPAPAAAAKPSAAASAAKPAATATGGSFLTKQAAGLAVWQWGLVGLGGIAVLTGVVVAVRR